MGGGSEKSSTSIDLKLVHHHENSKKKLPKGYLAVKVGWEEQKRFVIPVIYFNHPLFLQLLKEAEDEYGFDQKGTITIPCHVDHFLFVQAIINRDHRHHNHLVAACFRIRI